MRYIYDISSNKTRSSTGHAVNEDVDSFDALQPVTDHGGQVQPQTLDAFTAFEYPELPNNSEVPSTVPTDKQGHLNCDQNPHAYDSTVGDVPIDPVLMFDSGQHNLMRHEDAVGSGLNFHNQAPLDESMPRSTSPQPASTRVASAPSNESTTSTWSSPPIAPPAGEYELDPRRPFNQLSPVLPAVYTCPQAGSDNAFTQVHGQNISATMPMFQQAQGVSTLSVIPFTRSGEVEDVGLPQPSTSTALIPDNLPIPPASGPIRRTGKQCSPNSQLLCKDQNCGKRFHDKRTLKRHIDDVHNPNKATWFCPGLGAPREGWMKKCTNHSGYARSDSLQRHIYAAEESNPCRTEAVRLGWSPTIPKSIENLKDFRPA
ncbi:uncharacterized protein FOMMEDRAFT_30268 [Fomitiporia mediterranea MF3/22]|uniref:uncharacterized protein n=1 Tax=Fomitiporia mediterranea (strain MF3/22) TaxID=694068 RepID=UPI00044077BF|nr:uncharacterized protein FOMMEDRAFT_30268 [Fomitiporia mediterranea MF3/22]EJD01624.1 hypothetical protein FOMMEDRAFT_30268 [Fomitiporia mediterranea MF3/22]